jgi:uncharacterized protein YciI
VACLLRSDGSGDITKLLFAVLLNDIAQFAELRSKYGDKRNEFLMSLNKQGRLLLEGTFGERGCLMLIEAESLTDVLSVLQSDPYVVGPISSSVLIRSLDINVLGNTELLFRTRPDGDEPSQNVSRKLSDFRPLNRR